MVGRVKSPAGDRAPRPARAIRCTAELRDAARAGGISSRIGVHAGEVEITGDDIARASSDVAAVLAATAQPGEILATRIVEELVVGSGIAFADRGTHSLGGTAREWSLVAVTDP